MTDRNCRPRLRVIDGTRGPNSDPGQVTTIWNREWTPGEHGGYAFTTETARVDVVNPQPARHLRVFAGGSRSIGDRVVIDAKIKALPRCAVILTSRTHGASAAIRDATMRCGLRLEVWTAMTDR